MSKLTRILSLVGCLFLITFAAQAQEFGEYNDMGYNQNSIRPIHKSHIMYQKTLWFRVLLKEKMNKPFFATNMEITRLIIDAAKLGYVKPYTSDSLTRHMSSEDFLKKLQVEEEGGGLSAEELEMGFGAEESEDWDSDGGWGDESGGGGDAANNEYLPADLNILEIKEHLIFDKKHSRMKHDIQSITIKIPAELRLNGLEEKLATFSYKELVENLFRENPEAIWYNEHNTRNHLNLEHAFDLRLFDGWIYKYANGADLDIVDIYNTGASVQTLVHQMQYSHYLTEYENNLWEN